MSLFWAVHEIPTSAHQSDECMHLVYRRVCAHDTIPRDDELVQPICRTDLQFEMAGPFRKGVKACKQCIRVIDRLRKRVT